jgi:inhibitor of KinA
MNGERRVSPEGAQLTVLGDSCISVQFAPVIDPVVNARCVSLATAIEHRAIRGVRDVVTTYNAVAVHFDPSVIESADVLSELRSVADAPPDISGAISRTIEIPVIYGGESGPDLAAVAAFARCSDADVVRLHSGTRYRVYMMGFLPGFPYMGSVDARIAMPRLDAPRPRVAAGSVAIAAQQTGIYPFDTPGGWRIIGRTSTRLFDANRPEPFFLRAGDQVSFVPV